MFQAFFLVFAHAIFIMFLARYIVHVVPFSGVLPQIQHNTTTDSTQHPQYTAHHTHSLPLPTSLVFLTIHDKLLIAQDFDACLASILAAMASPSDQSIVVGGGLAGMSAANTVLGNGGGVFLLDKFTSDTLKGRAKKPELAKVLCENSDFGFGAKDKPNHLTGGSPPQFHSGYLDHNSFTK